MKQLFFAAMAASAIFLNSCGSSETAADKMANELCVVMSKYKEGDKDSQMETAKGMLAISEKKTEYGTVTPEAMLASLKKSCPDGYAKLKTFPGFKDIKE